MSKPVGTITVDEGITRHGSVGNTLVKGVNMELAVEAFSVKPGGVVERLVVNVRATRQPARRCRYQELFSLVVAQSVYGATKDEIVYRIEQARAFNWEMS